MEQLTTTRGIHSVIPSAVEGLMDLRECQVGWHRSAHFILLR